MTQISFGAAVTDECMQCSAFIQTRPSQPA